MYIYIYIYIYHKTVVPDYKAPITKYILLYMIINLVTELYPTLSNQPAIQDDLSTGVIRFIKQKIFYAVK